MSVILYNKKIDENYYIDNYNIVTSNLSVAIPAFVVLKKIKKTYINIILIKVKHH